MEISIRDGGILTAITRLVLDEIGEYEILISQLLECLSLDTKYIGQAIIYNDWSVSLAKSYLIRGVKREEMVNVFYSF